MVMFNFFIFFQLVVAIGAFCLIMALYETFEYAACYKEEKKEQRQKMMEELQSRDRERTDSRHRRSSDEEARRLLDDSDAEYLQLQDMSACSPVQSEVSAASSVQNSSSAATKNLSSASKNLSSALVSDVEEGNDLNEIGQNMESFSEHSNRTDSFYSDTSDNKTIADKSSSHSMQNISSANSEGGPNSHSYHKEIHSKKKMKSWYGKSKPGASESKTRALPKVDNHAFDPYSSYAYSSLKTASDDD